MRLRKIQKKINFLIKFVDNTKIFHILRDLNKEVDKRANKAVPLDKGTLNLNGINQSLTLP